MVPRFFAGNENYFFNQAANISFKQTSVPLTSEASFYRVTASNTDDRYLFVLLSLSLSVRQSVSVEAIFTSLNGVPCL